MIIKNLYIEKFGGITDKKIEFDSKLNIIYAENESGKSTVAEFIKLCFTELVNHRKTYVTMSEQGLCPGAKKEWAENLQYPLTILILQ